MLTLVTGATGAVGRRFVPRLLGWLRPGDAVRLLVRDTERAAPLAALGAQLASGDLRDPQRVRQALTGVDAVVNVAAAFRGVPDEEAWAVNRDAAVDLARAAIEAGVGRFVQVSTTLTYGPGRGRPLVEEDESVPGGHLWGAYSASKAEAERDLLALHRDHGLDVRIASLAFVYGEGDGHLAQSLRWARHWPAHRRLSLVHHADVAHGLLRLLRAPGLAGRKYHLVDDAPVSAVDLLQINGEPIPEGMAERDLSDPWEGLVSHARIRRELGWRPLYPSLWTAWDAGAL